MRTKRVLKRWIKYSILAIVVISAIALLINVNGKMEQNFVENCESQGYSHNYCVVHS